MRSRLLAVAGLVLGAMVAAGQEVPGHGVSMPKVIKVVKAVYTPEARAARIEGTVALQVVVLTDGTVGDDVKILKSLDTKFGLDEQAVNASKQWRFIPAMRDGKPVNATVTIEQSFFLNSTK
jgi:TonB family protein